MLSFRKLPLLYISLTLIVLIEFLLEMHESRLDGVIYPGKSYENREKVHHAWLLLQKICFGFTSSCIGGRQDERVGTYFPILAFIWLMRTPHSAGIAETVSGIFTRF